MYTSYTLYFFYRPTHPAILSHAQPYPATPPHNTIHLPMFARLIGLLHPLHLLVTPLGASACLASRTRTP